MKKLLILMTLPLYPMDIKEQHYGMTLPPHEVTPRPSLTNDHFATVYGMNDDTVITIIKTPNDSKRNSHDSMCSSHPSSHLTHNARTDTDDDESSALFEAKRLAEVEIESRCNTELKEKKLCKKERARIAAASAVIAALITASVTLTLHFTNTCPK